VKRNFNLEVHCLGLTNVVTKLATFAVLIAVPAVAGNAASASVPRHNTSPAKVRKTSSSTRSHSKKRVRGQKAIDSNRTRQIQTALIREHYLDGQPTGAWDARTKQAMVKFQTENGWQTKKVPDARAIIKLGLGPDRADLINPETAFVMPVPSAKGGGQVSSQPQQ
jgi:hypothetical protein